MRQGEGRQLNFTVPGILFTCYGLKIVLIVSTLVLYGILQRVLVISSLGVAGYSTIAPGHLIMFHSHFPTLYASHITR